MSLSFYEQPISQPLPECNCTGGVLRYYRSDEPECEAILFPALPTTVGYTPTASMEALRRSNYRVVKEDLGDFYDSVELHSDGVVVRLDIDDCQHAIDRATEMSDAIESYPVLDDCLYGRIEHDIYRENLDILDLNSAFDADCKHLVDVSLDNGGIVSELVRLCRRFGEIYIGDDGLEDYRDMVIEQYYTPISRDVERYVYQLAEEHGIDGEYLLGLIHERDYHLMALSEAIYSVRDSDNFLDWDCLRSNLNDVAKIESSA